MLLSGAGRPGELRWHEEYPLAETLDALAMLDSAHRAAGWTGTSTPSWWLHQIVLDDLVVGDVGFHGPPAATEPAEVEIGYAVVEALRGRGIATRACHLVLEVAWRDGAALVRAEADESNPASVRVLRAAGFTALGDRRFRIRRPAGVAG